MLEWYTVQEFAAKFNTSPTTVRVLIRDGYLNAIRLGSDKASYRIHRVEVERVASGEKEVPLEDTEDE